MRKLILFAIIFGSVMSFSPATTSAAVIIPKSETNIIPQGDLLKKIASLKLREFQKLAGRKLTLKEKIGFLVLKHKIKRSPQEASGKGNTAFVFGVVGLGLFVLGLFVPYVILGALVSSILAIVVGSTAYKQDKNDRKAHAGKLLGWITLGLIALLFLLAAIVLASWGF